MNPSNTVSMTTLIEEIKSESRDQTGISPSKASKLISIVQDDRIRQHSKVFEKVSACTTIDQATLLKDGEFHELVNNDTKEGVLKVSDIT